MRSTDAGTALLRRAIGRNRGRLTVGSALIGAHQACEALVPVLIGVIVDRAVATGDPGRLVFWLGVLAALFAVLTGVYRHGARRLTAAIVTEAHRLRLEVAAKILDPRGLRTDLRTGDLLTVSTTDADNTSHLLDHVPRVVGAVVATGVGAAALLVVSVPLGLVVLVATPLVLAALQAGAPLLTRHAAEQQERAGEATSLATDLVSGLRPLRGLGAQEAAAARYHEVSRRSLAATLRAARTQGLHLGASVTVSTLLTCGIALLAGWFALTGRIGAGGFVTVIGLATFLVEPFGTLAVAPSLVARTRASANRIASVLDAPFLAPPVPPDLPVRPGEFVGVVCSAADAADLVSRLRGDPGVLVEPHDTDLFTGTIGSNVVLERAGGLEAVPEPAGGPEAVPGAADGLEAVLRASAAGEVVDAHPDGLDHAVTERGASLSGGQRQRLALARALLARPRTLVLHDPTTAVDTVTEHGIADGLRTLRHGPGSDLATLVITNSPALLARTDRVVIWADGTEVTAGTHAHLAATDPAYAAAVLR